MLEAASSSGVDDTVVGVVGVYCPHLTHLDVSYTAVSNRGLECLVLPQVRYYTYIPTDRLVPVCNAVCCYGTFFY